MSSDPKNKVNYQSVVLR